MTGAWRPILAVGAGGAAGTLLRFSLSAYALEHFAALTFLATLCANCLGAGLAGYLVARRLKSLYHAFLVTGFCGGFTTFSFFSLEMLVLFQRAPHWMLAYAGASITLWLVFATLGHRLGQPRAA